MSATNNMPETIQTGVSAAVSPARKVFKWKNPFLSKADEHKLKEELRASVEGALLVMRLNVTKAACNNEGNSRYSRISETAVLYLIYALDTCGIYEKLLNSRGSKQKFDYNWIMHEIIIALKSRYLELMKAPKNNFLPNLRGGMHAKVWSFLAYMEHAYSAAPSK